jgi:putative addiction module component (TIGR02574 family)
MAATLDELKQQCAGLTSQERANLACFLLDSLEEEEEGDVETAWQAEVSRRVAEIRAGEVTGIPAEQVFAELREKYEARRSASGRQG